MRLIDADALTPHTIIRLTATGERTQRVVYADQIDNAQTIEERKKGEWLELTNTNHTYVCSVCGRMLVNITDGKNNVAKNYPYCHCGADMRKREEE